MRRLAVFGSIAAILLAGCGAEKPSALLDSAKTYLAKNDAKSAVIQLKTALQKQPDLAEARFLLGRTLLDQGDPVSAAIELRKAIDLKQPDFLVVPLLASAMLLGGQGQRVVADYAQVKFAEPEATAALKATLAGAYLQTGNKGKAQAALGESLSASPSYAPARLMQARLKAADHEFDTAFALVERVLANDPGNHQALQLNGDLLFFVRADAAAALQAQRQAVAQRADWLPAHVSMLEILLSGNDLAAAKVELEALKKVLPKHPQTQYYETRIAFLNREFKTARELVQPLLNVAPRDVKVLLLAAGIETHAGSLTQAETLATKALQLAPDAESVRRLLAQIFLRSGQALKAREALAPLLDKPGVTAETLNLAGQASLQNGDAKSAESYFTRAAKLAPKDVVSRTSLALAQFARGHADVGFAQLQEVAASDKGTVADMALISLKLRQRDYDGALRAVDAMERKQPGKPVASQLRGQVQVARKDYAAARLSFAKALSLDPQYFPAAAGLATLDLRDKRPDEARKHFDKLLAVDPRNVRALLAIADLRKSAGAGKDELAGLFANAAKLNPTIATPRLLLVELNLRARDYKAALAAAQEGAAALPESAEIMDALGRAHLASGDIDQAISSFNRVAAMQPRAPEPRLRLAEAYMALKKVDEARENLNRALEVAPNFLNAQRDLVILELSAGRPDQAMAVARKLQAERPDHAFGYLFAGDIESYRKNWEAAATAYRAGLKRGRSPEMASKLHRVLLTANKRSDADAFAAGWIKDNPRDAFFRVYLADLALAQLDFEAAESNYRAVLQMGPENAAVLNNLAWVTNKLKKPGAAAYAEKANALQPNQPVIMDTLATILSDEGQVAKALDLQKKAVALGPDYRQARLNLAKLYLKKGDKALAKTELDQLAKLGDKFAGHEEVTHLLESL
jgi:putative PEP-CTERM system TPR-repeat lipoprotein